jgi:hypothetical protein
MLSLGPNVRIYLCTAPTDMRSYAVSVVMRSRAAARPGTSIDFVVGP